MVWRVANAIAALRTSVNIAWPNRSKVSDGTIGDIAHQNQGSASDHNPWIIVDGIGVVRAFDITCDGIPHFDVAERLRILGSQSDPRLTNGGYVIHERQIAGGTHSWDWRPYTGSDPHTSHIHVSVSRIPSDFDKAMPWNVVPIVQKVEDDMPKSTLVSDPKGAIYTVTVGALHLGKAWVRNPSILQAILNEDEFTGGMFLTSRDVIQWPQELIDAYRDVNAKG
jgi:hypothetical protein